jgi:hypothetical protein
MISAASGEIWGLSNSMGCPLQITDRDKPLLFKQTGLSKKGILAICQFIGDEVRFARSTVLNGFTDFKLIFKTLKTDLHTHP